MRTTPETSAPIAEGFGHVNLTPGILCRIMALKNPFPMTNTTASTSYGKYKYSYIEGVIASDTPGSKKNMIHIMLAKKRFRGLLEIIIILWDIAANL